MYSSTCISYQTQVTNKKPEKAKGGTDLGGVQICVNYGRTSSPSLAVNFRQYDENVTRDVSGFVRLFYILSKNKIFRIFPKNIHDY